MATFGRQKRQLTSCVAGGWLPFCLWNFSLMEGKPPSAVARTDGSTGWYAKWIERIGLFEAGRGPLESPG